MELEGRKWNVILLMATRNPARKPSCGTGSLSTLYLTGFYGSQVVSRISAINSIESNGRQFQCMKWHEFEMKWTMMKGTPKVFLEFWLVGWNLEVCKPRFLGVNRFFWKVSADLFCESDSISTIFEFLVLSQISAGVWRHGPAYKGSSEKCIYCTRGSSWKKGVDPRSLRIFWDSFDSRKDRKEAEPRFLIFWVT